MTAVTTGIVAALATAVLLATPPVRAQGQVTSSADAGEARALFVQATALLREGRHDAACERLERVLRNVDAPNVRWNLAFCRRSLGDEAAALRHLQAFVRAVPPDDPRVAIAVRLLVELEARTATLTVRVSGPPSGLAVTLDGEPLPPSEIGRPWRVDEGRLTVRLTRDRFTVQTHEIDLAAGEWRTVDLVAPPAPTIVAAEPPAPRPLDGPVDRTPPRRRRAVLWTAGAVAVAAAVATFAAVRVSGRDDRHPLPDPAVTVQTR